MCRLEVQSKQGIFAMLKNSKALLLALIWLACQLNGALAQEDIHAQIEAFTKKYSIDLVVSGFDFSTEAKVTGTDSEQVDRYLPLFFSEFNLYPPELVKKSGVTKIVLCKDLKYAGQKRAAYPGLTSGVMCYDVERGSHSEVYQRSSIHHEYFHLIDYRDDRSLYIDRQWDKLNPVGFTYGIGGKNVQDDETQSLTFDQLGFMNKYSTQGVEEDKAEIFAYLMTRPELMRQRVKTDSVVASKTRMLKNLLASFSESVNEEFWKSAAKVDRPKDVQVSSKTINLPKPKRGPRTIEDGTIGAGTIETPWYVINSGIAGPTVLVVGGVHGNEPAGYRAAEQIRRWPIVKGKLVVIPQLNRLGMAANTRWLPDFRNDRKLRDLNRNFPSAEGERSQTPLAEVTWEFIKKHNPDWVFDLHEGFDFHRINSKSVGSSVIAMPWDERFAKGMVDVVNSDIKPERHFDLLVAKGPAIGSLARACSEVLDAKSFILETTFKDQPISTRTRQHRQMVSLSLQRIGMIERDLVDQLSPARRKSLTRVGVFDATGANEAKVISVPDRAENYFACHLGPEDIKPEILEQFDVLVFPGGSGSKQAKAIGEQGREHIRQFAKKGGGVVGICAGAYLCSSHYDWSLDLVNAAVFNKTVEVPGKGKKSVWFRGPATDVDVEINEKGKQAVGLGGLHSIRYQNGPILSAGDHKSLPKYEVLAHFRSENGIYEQQKNTMIDAPAIVFAEYGKGRVIAISPHFESTRGKESVVLKAIDFVNSREY